MDRFIEAEHLYGQSRRLIDVAKSTSMASDELRWAVEDLTEALLDLKLARIELDLEWVEQCIYECRTVAAEILELIGLA